MMSRRVWLSAGGALSFLGLFVACGSDDFDPVLDDDEAVGFAQESIRKGFPGAVNGMADYCDNPAALCAVGEGDCDSNAQCTTGNICGRDNGAKFNLPAGSDVCIPATCQNKKKDPGETIIDCGGVCGTNCGVVVCPPPAAPTNGQAGHCTADCPCPSGQGDCNTASECTTGLACGSNNGPKYGLAAGVDACTPTACTNGIKDTPNETGVDCGGTCGACQFSFSGIGDLAGGAISSDANAVSNGGSVVVGKSESTTGTQAFRWTSAGGIVGLGDLPGGLTSSIAYAVSSDGSVVVGRGRTAAGPEAFRWTSAGMVSIGDLPGGAINSEAWGISANGTVVVGPGTQASGQEAFRWTSAGMVGLGELAGGGFNSRAYASDATGSTIVGRSSSSLGTQAFRWTSGGMVALGDLAGGTFGSVAVAVNADGTVVVGFGTDAAGSRAFRWTQATGMVAVPLISGATTSFAQGVSGDGTIVVGTATGAGGNTAFIYKTTTGIASSIVTTLNNQGVFIPGWTLTAATGISPDGKWVVGSGTNPSGNPEGWVAKLQ